MERTHVVQQLRALAALELELNLLVARKVSEARRLDVSWEDIAAAVGVGTPTAWRRWKDIIDDPRPTGQARRGSRVVLDSQAGPLVRSLTEELAQQTLNPEGRQPWASAVRAALQRRTLRYEVTQRSGREIEFRVPAVRLQIRTLEPSSTGPGGLSTVTLLDPERSLGTGAPPPRTNSLTSDGLWPEAEHALGERVQQFIDHEVAIARQTAAGA